MKLTLKTTRTTSDLYLQMESEAYLLINGVYPTTVQSLYEGGFLDTKDTPAMNVDSLREILDLVLNTEKTFTLFQAVRFDQISESWNAIPSFCDLYTELKNEIVAAGMELVELPRYWDGYTLATLTERDTITDEGEPWDPDDDDDYDDE